MIEEIIKPKDKNYNLSIPTDYIGKDVKIILYTLDEVNKQPHPKKKLSELAGMLSRGTAEEMRKHIAESRSEWDDRLSKQF